MLKLQLDVLVQLFCIGIFSVLYSKSWAYQNRNVKVESLLAELLEVSASICTGIFLCLKDEVYSLIYAQK